jgi:hypothetical protein
MEVSLSPFDDIEDSTWRPADRLRLPDVAAFPYPGWIWLCCILFGVAIWAGVGLGIRGLIAAF